MKVISVIEDEDVIGEILQRRTSPQAPRIMGGKSSAPGQSDWATQGPEYSTDYSTSHIPISDKCLYVDPEYPETLPS